jgi:transcriptional regulator with XRE-family HTH domain
MKTESTNRPADAAGPSTDRATTGQAIRDRRLRRGLTQFKLAALAGVSLQTVSLAERAGFLTPQTATRLAAALGIRAEDLLAAGDRRQSGGV